MSQSATRRTRRTAAERRAAQAQEEQTVDTEKVHDAGDGPQQQQRADHEAHRAEPPPSDHGDRGSQPHADDAHDEGVEVHDGHEDRAPPPLPSSTFSATSERDHVKIMLATDNHVGYMERDPVRSQDSIRTFEEILQLAVQHEVDLILLGGDLFHENKPSRATMHQVMALLRQYTLGDKPIQVELLSDPNDGALPGFNFPAVNYEDQNLNVSIPVFSIHGNHDDPQGTGETGALSALDLLSVSGLINYFGRIELPSDDATAAAPSSRAAKGGGFQEKGIRIKPVLLQKGNTKLAIYGMGNIKDERMHFELRANRVRMFRPQEDPDSWFNILCVHQNRVAHNPKACVPETMFDDSVHLVVWGHEHEQLIQPQPVAEKRYHITQPGSSIATSLSPGEAVEKCVAIIHVENTDFLIEPIPLKTVRPFVMDDMVLAEELEEHDLESRREDIMKLLRMRVNGLIDRARREFAERHPGAEMPLPLVRLRVEYTNQEISNPQRFGQEFTGKVANPKDVLQFTKRKAAGGSKGKEPVNAYVDVDGLDLLPSEKLERVDVGMLVREYLQAQNLDILNPEGLEGAVLNFVEKDDKEAIDSFVNKMLRNTVKGLVTIDPEEAQLQNELERLRQQQQRGPRDGGDGDGDDDDEDEGGGGAGRDGGGRRKAAPSAARSKSGKTVAADSDDSMMEELDAGGDAFDEDVDAFDDDDRGVGRRGGGSRASPRKGGRSGAGAASTRGRTAAGSTRAASSRRAAAKAPQRTFLGPSDDDEDGDGFEIIDDDAQSDVDMDERDAAPAPTSRHAAALGLSTSRAASPTKAKRAAATTRTRGAAPTKKASSAADGAGMRQSQLSFASARASPPAGRGGRRGKDRDDAVDVDDDDEFEEPAPVPARTTRGAATGATRRTSTRR
ncbi:meiotic recombination [Thecaphora frezii]